jgi:hypothetical protein
VRRTWLVLVVAASSILAACTSNPQRPSRPTVVQRPAPGQCLGFPNRWPPIPASSIETRMASHLPQWLPPGWATEGAFGPTGGEAVVEYGGRGCATVDDYLVFDNLMKVGGPGPGEVQAMVNPRGPHVGPWLVARQSTTYGCPGLPGLSTLQSGAVKLCLEYQAKVPEGVLAVQMVGLDRATGDRIVQSIPL